MHGLEVPADLTGARVERDDRVAVEVRAGPIAAVEVGARRADRQEHPAAPEIGGDGRPDVRRARQSRARLPALGARLTRVRNGVEGPAQRAGSHVERAHIPGRRVGSQRVSDRRADDDDVADDGSGRRHVVLPVVVHRCDACEQIYAAGFTEPGARRARRRVEREQPSVQGREEDALRAGGVRIGVAPVGDPAVDPHVRVGAPGLELRVERPQLAARLGVERDRAVARRGEEEPAVDDERRRLERAPAIHRQREGTAPEVAVPIGPDDAKLAHVLGCDLREGRIAAAAGSALGDRPVGDSRVGARRGRGGQGEEEAGRRGAQGLHRLRDNRRAEE